MQFSFSGPKTLKTLLVNTKPADLSLSHHIRNCVLGELVRITKKKKTK